MFPEKIPIEFLLKKSRQEVGELKSYIDELKYEIEKRDKEIASLNKKIKKYQDLTKVLKPSEQVNRTLSSVIGGLNYVKDPHKVKREKKRIKLYQRSAKYYNAWYDGCKLLLSILQELRTLHID